MELEFTDLHGSQILIPLPHIEGVGPAIFDPDHSSLLYVKTASHDQPLAVRGYYETVMECIDLLRRVNGVPIPTAR